MLRVMRWTTRSFEHTLPVGLLAAVLERLRGTPARAEELLRSATESVRRWRPPDTWSAQQHVGHLDDLHALDMARVDAFLAGAAVLTAADMTNRATHEADHNGAPTEELLRRFRTHRDALVRRLEMLDEAQAARTATHPRLQRPMNVVEWMYFVAEHDDHHLASARAVLSAAQSHERL